MSICVDCNTSSSLFQQRRLDFKTLTSAVDAGDTAAAQTALQDYQQDNQSIEAADGSSEFRRGGPFRVKIKADLLDLTSAVELGKITDAQAALKTLREDRAAIRQAKTDAKSEVSPLPDDMTKLIRAILSGDSAGEQASADAVANDLLSAAQSGKSEKSRGHQQRHDRRVEAAGDGSVTPNSSAAAEGSARSSATSDTGQTTRLAAILKQFAEAFLELTQTTQAVL